MRYSDNYRMNMKIWRKMVGKNLWRDGFEILPFAQNDRLRKPVGKAGG